MKKWMMDALFLVYVIVILPVLSLFYFAYTFTNLEMIFVIIGAIVFYLIFIPYPVYWYLKNRIFI